MEYTEKTTKPLKVFNSIHLFSSFSSPSSSSSSSSSRSSSFPAASQGPCAACKVLRRRCTESCILAPYFPSTKPFQFITAHKVFGASNIIKWLKEVPETNRADAVSSMVYEANARILDPVYGCAGAISKLQKQLKEVQAELAMTQAELLFMRCQQQQLDDNAKFLHRNSGSANWE